MYLLFRADQRLKQNHEDVNLPVLSQERNLLEKEIGPILNHKIIQPSIIQCPSNWALFFVMVIYLEKMMERLNSGDWKMIFENISSNLNIDLMICWRARWQEAEATRKDIEIELIHQHKKILPPSSSRSSRTQSHWSFITRQCIHSERFRVHLSHAQSICTPSWVQSWHWKG